MTETTSGPAARKGKRPRKGLTVQRINTTPGVHPYDQVTWERRDVVMTNWRDGSVNFEQHGVEFPGFWSVNAGNIVTTKYFRGAVGTPQREWSLKQLVDRVTDVYTATGREHGYFATDEDAETFDHELKWALIHQVFSFNSPVWFNVGTASPQQVSACQPYDALVSTPAGLIPIGKLVADDAVGTKVYDAHGTTKIVATQANGVKPVLRLHTKAGYALDVTADHLVWRSTDQFSGRFVPAGTLKPGDKLLWNRRDSFGEKQISSYEIAEAALAGWLQSDGFVGQYEQGTNRSLTIEAMTVTDAELGWVTEALDQVFPGVHRHERSVETQDERLDCRRTRLYGEFLREFVERWGLLARGTAMEVPDGLFTAPLPVVAAYLRSVFQAEGFVSARAASTLVEVDMISEKLVKGMQQLLLRFGIFARVGFKKDARADRHGCWTLRIQSAGDRRQFADAIGFIDPVKAEKLERSFDKPGREAHETKRLEIDRIEQLDEMEVYDIQTESGEYLSSNLRVHNCFILAVDDTMDSILEWYREEGLIFKGGSGAGVNLSRIRSSKELLTSGGTASGPVSFMRGADASAGTIKSGGATRRAAKMVVLDVDHPDVADFIQTKAREEDKIRVLRDAGFDMDLGGQDIVSVQYQNANNSIRVSDEFMRAVENDGKFGLHARLTGETLETVEAKDLFRKIAQAAWECADPGIQYDDTINDWHTNPESGRITASNPCFPADQRIVTDKGLIKIGDLVQRAANEEQFAVYTNDVTAEISPQDRVTATIPSRYMITGRNEIIEIRFSDGSRIRCTPGHRIWTANRGWVHAEELTADDEVVRSLQYAPRTLASRYFPGHAVAPALNGRARKLLELPAKWSPDFAHYLGWLIGDGCIQAGNRVPVTVYGSAEDQEFVLPRHHELLTKITRFEGKPSVQANGTLQLRVTRAAFGRFLHALGVAEGRAPDKVVPDAVFEAPEDAVVAFLQGLFDADGCVVSQESNGTRYVGLGSRSEELLIGVQELLASFGVASRIYKTSDHKRETFHYTRKDGSEAHYGSEGPSYDLRITAEGIREFQRRIGFSLPGKQAKLDQIVAEKEFYKVNRTVTMVSRTARGYEVTYNLTEPRNHSYIVGGTVVANCSEYLSLDNSSCNLASINLLKFLRADDTFDTEKFARISELIITAMDISITFADFPTEKIGQTTRDYRQLGIGYANLGALLMATGHAYDSEGGRAIAAAITSLMTASAYKKSAELAGVVGPYVGYEKNEAAHKRVIRKHAAASAKVPPFGTIERDILDLANKTWQECVKLGDENGYRNAQASLLAPTGCLTPDTLVTTDRGLARLGELGDMYGDRWQDLDLTVSTDEGPRQATKFFVNGEEPTRRIVTAGGYTIQGTLAHRVKVVDPESMAWEWKRLADITPGDLLPMQMRTLIGQPRRVPLPVLDQAYYAGDRRVRVPDAVTPELAEIVGYFMGDGSLHAKGIRLCVADTDLDVVAHLSVLAKDLFGIEAVVTQQEGYRELVLQSVRLARWWQAAGFAKTLPNDDHSGKGWVPRIPSAILEANDPEAYSAFVRGLFEADGTVLDGVPSFSTAHASFAAEVRTMLLTKGLATTTRTTRSGWGGAIYQVRLRNVDHALNFAELIGFIGQRKDNLIVELEPGASAKKDYVFLPRTMWSELVPPGHHAHSALTQSIRKSGGGVPRMLATRVFEETLDARLAAALDYLFERVEANEDGGLQLTYDLSVPENVTYVANGMVSHNTIGFMMDCDTTGIEPDLALVKFKKLVGGGSMQIVNQTVPRALKNLGYQGEQIEAITEYIAEHGHVVNAPGLRQEHYEVFDCAMGERSIGPIGHVRMMASVQPFLSGSISKTVNMPESATVEEVEQIYFEGWKLGLKALAIYRDNCKVGQPLSIAKKQNKAAEETVAAPVQAAPAPVDPHVQRPVRKRMPRKRSAIVTKFDVAGAEGYMTASTYPDDGLGEVFLKLGKQGSTFAGVMDAFSIAISVGLQYGIPLESYVSKFTNMRFEPAGMTNDPDVRIATSVMDYIFRRLALDHLPYDQRAELGILSAGERAAQLAGQDPATLGEEIDPVELAQSVGVEAPHAEPPAIPPATQTASPAPSVPAHGGQAAPRATGSNGGPHSTAELIEFQQGRTADAPLCLTCGTKMRPAGSCYVCEGCGSTSGCS
jgi:ribonucleoside-diphosphate reductase alpha chain